MTFTNTLVHRLTMSFRGPSRIIHLNIIALLLVTAVFGPEILRATARQGGATSVVTVSAANFLAPVAPDSIVASFGLNLATGTLSATTQPLPTELLGTTVSVLDSAGVSRPAPLLFVSAGQINHLIPAGTAAGEATVTVRSGSGTTSTGRVEISTAAPAIFTAGQQGAGVAAGSALRVKRDGAQSFESLATTSDGRFIARPLDLGPEGERLFLVLFLTGVRNAPNSDGNNDNGSAESVQVLIGGVQQTPTFAGAQGSFAGLDQINVEIPRTLLDPTLPGSRQINVSVKAPGFPDSNEVEIALAPVTGSALAITGFDAPPLVLANSEIRINGSGISPVVADNRISFGEGGGDARPGEVRTASETRLSVLVPFGAVTGLITLNSDGKSWTSESPLRVRTSLSALVKDTDGQPFSAFFGARVCFPNCSAGNAVSNVQPGGWFVLPDPPAGNRRIFVIEVPTQPNSLSFNRTTISSPVVAERDNPLPQQVYLQAIYGPSAVVGGGGALNSTPGRNRPQQAIPELNLTIDGFTFTLPTTASATFPDGARSGLLTLTPVKNSLTPVPMPPGVFSSAVVQISPFGVELEPGGKLVFPNRDGLGAAPAPTLYKYDLNSASFIDTGIKAQLSEDGASFLTPAGAITETSIYFVGVPQKTTTIAGRVLDSDGRTPIRGAVVSSRGRNAVTDGNGGYSLPQVPTGEVEDEAPPTAKTSAVARRSRRRAQTPLIVETSYLRPSGRNDSAMQTVNDPVLGGVTDVPPLLLPPANSNRAPAINVAASTTIYAMQTKQLPVQVTELDAGQTIPSVTVGGAEFASIESAGGGSYTLNLAPQTGDVGERVLTLTATDSAGGSTSINVTVVVFPLPTAAAQAATTTENTPVAITLQGSDADNQPLTFAIVAPPANGTLTGTPPAVTYTPKAGFFGVDTFSFKVSNGMVESAPGVVTVTTVNPAPIITVITPESTTTINGPFEMRVAGEKFAAGAVVRFNGEARATTYISATELKAEITGTDIATAGLATITVFNPAPGGGVSNGVTFTIRNPEPTIQSLMPAEAISEGPGFTLTVKGSEFTPGSVVFWNGSPRETAYSSGDTLTAEIPASDIATAGFAQVKVVTPEPGGGETATRQFTINNPVPVLTSINPSTVTAGGSSFVMMFNGQDFRPSSKAIYVTEECCELETTYISSTQLSAIVPAFVINNGDFEEFHIVTPGPGGGESDPQVLTVEYPVPTLTMISPTSVPVDPQIPTLPPVGQSAKLKLSPNQAPQITLTGTNFFSATLVYVNGSERSRIRFSSTEILLFLEPSDVSVGGTLNITVENPTPGGGSAGPLVLTVENPTPIIQTLSPASVVAAGSGFSLSINGSNFVTNSVVRINGMDRSTIFVGPSILSVGILASEIADPGSISVQVFNPTPVGGTSEIVFLAITVPTPSIDMISPTMTTANGASPVVVTLTGSNFISNAEVYFCGIEGLPLSTNFISSTTIEATFSPAQLITNTTCPLTVFQSDSFTTVENESPNFTITALEPVLDSLSPTTVVIDSGDFTLTVMGDEYTTNTSVLFQENTEMMGPIFTNVGGTRVSKNEVMATVPGTLIDNFELDFFFHAVGVETPPPGGGLAVISEGVFVGFGSGFKFGGSEFRSDGTPARSRMAQSQLTDGRLITAGGRNSSGGSLFAIMSLVEAFDPVAEAWSRLANMIFPREDHTLSLLGGGLRDGRQAGDVVVIGGRGLQKGEFASRTVEIYDTATNTWRRAADTLFKHIGHTTTRLPDGRLLVVGGTNEQREPHGKTEIHDPQLNTWTEAGELAQARSGHDAILLADGRVIVIGGAGEDGARAGIEIFDPQTGFWTSGGSLLVARAGQTTNLLHDGRLLIVGGEGFAAQGTAEIYDPQTGISSLVGSLLIPRSHHTATLLADGNVLIAGGLNSRQEPTAGCEILDVSSGKWSIAIDLAAPRSNHLTVSLTDGRLLLLGNRVLTPRSSLMETYAVSPSRR